MASPLITKKIKQFFQGYPLLKVGKGQIMLHAGNTPEGVYYLTNGIIRHFIVSPEGKELTIHLYSPGSFLPLMWAINNQTPDYSLQALGNVSANIAPQDEFKKWLQSEPEILYDLASRLLYGLGGLSTRIEVISLENSRSRVVSILKYLHRHFGEQFSFTHEDLASLTGLTRERVSIEMKQLKDEGIVSYKRSKVSILKQSLL